MALNTKTTSSIKNFSRPVLTGALLVCSIMLTIIAWYISRTNLNEKTRDKFEYRVSNIQSAIEVRMAAYEQVLRGTVGFFYAADTISRAEWKSYVQTLGLEKLYPGIQGLGYTVRLSADEVESFTKKVRAEGFPTFTVWPEEARKEYHSILYLEPFEGRNLRAFGYDMYTEQKRRAAMQKAMNTGEPALSEMVTLVQETGNNVQKGCLLYLPVYNRKMSIGTVEERQAALKGFVYSPFRINDLMKGILGPVAPEVEMEIYDGRNTDSAHLFYTSHGYNDKKNKADFSLSRPIEVAGRDWTLVITSLPNFVSSYEANQPNVIALAGILVNFLLLFILIKINSLSRRNRMLAERYKAEKDRYEIVSLSTNDILWDWDIKKNTISWNKNYHMVLGYPLPYPEMELPYESWTDHLHPEDKERVETDIHALLHSDLKYWSNEYRLVKADGASIFILDRGRVIQDDNGTPVRMVGSMINITERKQAEEAQKRFNEELEKTVQERTIELQRSNEDLERFAHVTSHDLKEPVRKILTFIDLIRMKFQHPLGDGIELLDKVSKSASRLNHMIDGILAYSTAKYENQSVEPVDLNVIIQNVKDDLELIITEKKAQIIVEPLPNIEGSFILLHQLFYNLINNSLKFSRPGINPVIQITCETIADERIKIQVIDNGIGFGQEQANTIFQSFVRLHSKDIYEGTGLGLALCKRIVERHGGSIEAKSSVGEGTNFTVKLPKKQQSADV